MSINPITRAPILRTLINGSTRNGFRRSFEFATRGYHDYRFVAHQSQDRPETIEEGVRSVDRIIDAVKSAGFFSASNTLRLLVGTEGCWNGRPKFGGAITDAGFPLKASIEEAMVARACERLRLEAHGVVWIWGGSYIDCEKLAPDGRRIGEVRGCVIESGTGDLVRYGKKTTHPVDGWETNSFSVQEGSGPTYVTLKDRTGDGRDVKLYLEICADANMRLVNPLAADLLWVITGSGIDPDRKAFDPGRNHLIWVDQKQWPDERTEGPSHDPLVMDTRWRPADLQAARVTSYEAPGWPVMKRLHAAGLVDVVSAFSSLREYVGLTPVDLDAKVRRLSGERAAAILSENVKLLVLPERTLPGVDEETPRRLAEAVAEGADFIDRPVGTVVAPNPESPDQLLLDELAKDLQESPDPSWRMTDDPQPLDPEQDPVVEDPGSGDPDDQSIDDGPRE